MPPLSVIASVDVATHVQRPHRPAASFFVRLRIDVHGAVNFGTQMVVEGSLNSTPGATFEWRLSRPRES